MSQPTDKGLEPVGTVEDLLIGAHEIAGFLFGDRTRLRNFYWVMQRHRLPVFRLGGRLYARRSEIIAWFKKPPH